MRDLMKSIEQKAKTCWDIFDLYGGDEVCDKVKGCEPPRDSCWLSNPDCPRNKHEWVSVETVRTFFLAKERSLRKLLKERPAYLKSYDDGCNKQHLIQLLTIFEGWAKSLEKVFDETLAEKVSVDRKQLEDLLKDAPSYEELDDIGGMQNVSVQMWGSRVEEWISKVKEFVESSGEPLNLALAFADVKKKKSSGSDKPK